MVQQQLNVEVALPTSRKYWWPVVVTSNDCISGLPICFLCMTSSTVAVAASCVVDGGCVITDTYNGFGQKVQNVFEPEIQVAPSPVDERRTCFQSVGHCGSPQNGAEPNHSSVQPSADAFLHLHRSFSPVIQVLPSPLALRSIGSQFWGQPPTLQNGAEPYQRVSPVLHALEMTNIRIRTSETVPIGCIIPWADWNEIRLKK